MKFLVDAQLPRSLSEFLIKKGHDSKHTLDLPGKNSTPDSQILLLLNSENRVLISKDTDFLESFLLTQKPGKLIHVNTGNIKNIELLSIFDHHLQIVCTLLEDNSFIELNRTEIVAHI